MPVAAFFDGPGLAEHMVLLPDHQVRGAGADLPFAFGALVGFEGVDGGDVLDEPVSVWGLFDPGGWIQDAGDIPALGAGFLPFTGSWAGVGAAAGGAGFSGHAFHCGTPALLWGTCSWVGVALLTLAGWGGAVRVVRCV